MDDFFVRNRLSAYLDGELPTSEAREVEAALARNPLLRAEYEALRDLVEQVRTDGPLVAPPRLRAQLAERLAAEPMPSRWRRWLPAVPLEGLALAAIAVVALVIVSTPKGTSDAPPAPTPEVVAAPTPTPAEGDVSPAANGVLGDEARPLGTAGRQAMVERPTSTKKSVASKAVEKEPLLQDWELGSTTNTGNLGTTSTAPGSASPATSNTGSTLGSIPPYRYRLRTDSDAALKTLATIAGELGGKLVDASGRAVATYPMEAGDARSVRVVVPSYNVEALHARLRQMGDVETMAADASVLYAAGADVPIAIDVQRE